MGSSLRDRGPDGQWALHVFLSAGELSLVGSCPRTPKTGCPTFVMKEANAGEKFLSLSVT